MTADDNWSEVTVIVSVFMDGKYRSCGLPINTNIANPKTTFARISGEFFCITHYNKILSQISNIYVLNYNIMISDHYVFVLSGFLEISFDFLSFRLIILNIFLNINFYNK